MIKQIFFMLNIVVLLNGCAVSNPHKENITMYNAKGKKIGVVKLSEQSQGVQIKLDLKELPPGVHGIHIHEIGKCEAPNFKSAGGHYNPSNKKHGLMNQKGAHAGDLPNILVKKNGTVKATLFAREVTFSDTKGTLRGKKGATLIIDSRKDDGMSQPSGNSGLPIACGVISRGTTNR